MRVSLNHLFPALFLMLFASYGLLFASPPLPQTGFNGSWQRLAVIVSCKKGMQSDKPLQYTEEDGERLMRTLETVGEVSPSNIFFIRAENAKNLKERLDIAGKRLMSLRSKGMRVFLQFYYSGHGSNKNFHVYNEEVSFDEVKSLLRADSSEARMFVLDVCYGASFFNSKGFSTSAPLKIDIQLDTLTSGEVTISSSSADEQAYEVRSLQGSIFTSHWLLALRGAADKNSDGQVSLFEAYNYSYDRTVVWAAENLRRAQHPTYKMEIQGARDMLLSRPVNSSSGLLFRNCPSGDYGIFDLNRGVYVGEIRLPEEGEFTLALEEGSYEVQHGDKGKNLTAVVDLVPGKLTPLPFNQFSKSFQKPAGKKGSRVVTNQESRVPLQNGSSTETNHRQAAIQTPNRTTGDDSHFFGVPIVLKVSQSFSTGHFPVIDSITQASGLFEPAITPDHLEIPNNQRFIVDLQTRFGQRWLGGASFFLQQNRSSSEYTEFENNPSLANFKTVMTQTISMTNVGLGVNLGWISWSAKSQMITTNLGAYYQNLTAKVNTRWERNLFQYQPESGDTWNGHQNLLMASIGYDKQFLLKEGLGIGLSLEVTRMLNLPGSFSHLDRDEELQTDDFGEWGIRIGLSLGTPFIPSTRGVK